MRHFLEELDDLQKRLLEMGGLVEFAIRRSVTALVDKDEAAAQEVLRSEARINQMEIEIDDFAVRLLAPHQPMARDLRFLTAAIKINNDLERMGDLAVNIVERAISLMRQPPVKPLIDITGGAVREAGKARTRKRAMQMLYEQMIAAGAIEHVAVMHGKAPDIDEFLDLIAPHFPRDSIRVGELGAVIGSHGGAEILGASWVDAS